MNVTIVRDDLLDQDVDVIVNAWTRNIIPWWLLPQGVAPAITVRVWHVHFHRGCWQDSLVLFRRRLAHSWDGYHVLSAVCE
jgi:hypothetical protein